VLGLAVLLLQVSAIAVPQSRIPVRLWRLDCGVFVTKHLVNSCYVIRHGSTWMLWDTGFSAQQSAKSDGIRVDSSLTSELARIGLQPKQIGLIGLSHLHWDHVGQAADFPAARLLVGKEDWDAMAAHLPAVNVAPEMLAPWFSGPAPKTLVQGDQDIFGDGSVIMIATPGHTPGHHSLLVRLARQGPVLLTGDLYHSTQQFEAKQVPPHDADPEQTKASFERFDALVQELNATLIIQHEPADVAKLPRFPRSAG
jgi:N-acyl homoserine lactone hydrolase